MLKAAAVVDNAANGISKTISAIIHISGTTKSGKGYLNSLDEAQEVLDAVYSGEATYLGTTSQGHLVYKFDGVTGTNVNLGAGIIEQTTNVFMINGEVSVSVVPTNPFWTP